MDAIQTLRQQIDELDSQMRELFVTRMNIVKNIAEYKMKNDLVVYDSLREQEVISKNTQPIADSEFLPYYTEFIHSVMKISKEFQKSLIIRSVEE